ncbi:hypothetical protein EPUS_03258 [Endocarpon pusillum Z07020]|uniref:Uncharacterized protein n=1 Tax=Endocarpon pusillum (strain Z07020 / HMAS-L-300199) TaxID=1263415 RepID=U1HZ93_ENDPU|nr:uncharacterized protein EPUS_03258 [Endocarpon pusillum Z07020]ERF74874.1 hypothetical protein EPUS_03258 [Endocarpon pusillum Z07020]
MKARNSPYAKKRQRRNYKGEEDDAVSIEIEYAFVNTTIETIGFREPRRIKSSPCSSTGDEMLQTCQTPPSSICSEELIDPVLFREGLSADPNAYDTAEPSCSEAGLIQDDSTCERDALVFSSAILADLQREENPVLKISGYQVEEAGPGCSNKQLKYD